jgi:hypothetical protein
MILGLKKLETDLTALVFCQVAKGSKLKSLLDWLLFFLGVCVCVCVFCVCHHNCCLPVA